jgi:hypothetical protein
MVHGVEFETKFPAPRTGRAGIQTTGGPAWRRLSKGVVEKSGVSPEEIAGVAVWSLLLARRRPLGQRDHLAVGPGEEPFRIRSPEAHPEQEPAPAPVHTFVQNVLLPASLPPATPIEPSRHHRHLYALAASRQVDGLHGFFEREAVGQHPVYLHAPRLDEPEGHPVV